MQSDLQKGRKGLRQKDDVIQRSAFPQRALVKTAAQRSSALPSSPACNRTPSSNKGFAQPHFTEATAHNTRKRFLCRPHEWLVLHEEVGITGSHRGGRNILR